MGAIGTEIHGDRRVVLHEHAKSTNGIVDVEEGSSFGPVAMNLDRRRVPAGGDGHSPTQGHENAFAVSAQRPAGPVDVMKPRDPRVDAVVPAVASNHLFRPLLSNGIAVRGSRLEYRDRNAGREQDSRDAGLPGEREKAVDVLGMIPHAGRIVLESNSTGFRTEDPESIDASESRRHALRVTLVQLDAFDGVTAAAPVFRRAPIDAGHLVPDGQGTRQSGSDEAAGSGHEMSGWARHGMDRDAWIRRGSRPPRGPYQRELRSSSIRGYRAAMHHRPSPFCRLVSALAALLLVPSALGQTPAAPDEQGPGHRFGREVPLAKADGGLRVASYNVLNLFDPVDDPTLDGKYDDLPMATSRDRCESMARAIRAIDADVLCLQEVESEDALRWFRDEFLADMGYDHVASRDVGYYRGVEQSVLSRFPITSAVVWPDEDLADMEARKTGDGWEKEGDLPTKFQRSPLMVDVEVPGKGSKPYVLSLVVVHHKSGRHRRQRESEALQLVDLLEARLKEEADLNLIVLGDFNAGPFDRSVKVYKDAGFVNAYEHRWQREGDTRDLFRTHESDRVIDYVMLHPNADAEVVEDTFQVVGTLHPGDKYDWRKDEPPSGYAADHYPLVIDLRPVEAGARGSR